MFIEGLKYKLVGYRPIGIEYNIHREEIAEYKNGNWYSCGCGKEIVNFVIEEIIEI